MKRTASAEWKGGLKDGKGNLTTKSGVLSHTAYSFNDRFAEGTGTNPEELLAASHAGCFSMALSMQLGEAHITAESIETSATVSLENVDGGFKITESHLQVKVKAPGADRASVEKAAKNAETGCPISKVLNAKISMDLTVDA